MRKALLTSIQLGPTQAELVDGFAEIFEAACADANIFARGAMRGLGGDLSDGVDCGVLGGGEGCEWLCSSRGKIEWTSIGKNRSFFHFMHVLSRTQIISREQSSRPVFEL